MTGGRFSVTFENRPPSDKGVREPSPSDKVSENRPRQTKVSENRPRHRNRPRHLRPPVIFVTVLVGIVF